MAATNELLTYGDSSIREDVVLNAIEYLTARESQVFNMLGKVTAISTIHSFLTDTLRTAASAAIPEDGDYTILASSTPTRLTNLIEIVAIPFQVSRTQQQVAHYTGENELQRQTQKALFDWANAAEFDLIRGTLTSGVSGTAPTFNGMIANSSLANNHTSQTSGTIFNTSILDSLMGTCWTNSNGDVADNLLMGQWLRQKMDQAIQKSNVVVNTPNGLETVIRTVSTYQTSFGTLSIRTHRYIQQSGDSTGRIFGFRADKNKIAFLANGGKPYIDTEIARSGDYDKRSVIGKFTPEVHNQNSEFYCDGFNLAS
ncbi:MAG: DUF5309 family protein [Patescibacteria group bacterium]|nr:DUF5309 family protein [Patescibacteria group bacterium]